MRAVESLLRTPPCLICMKSHELSAQGCMHESDASASRPGLLTGDAFSFTEILNMDPERMSGSCIAPMSYIGRFYFQLGPFQARGVYAALQRPTAKHFICGGFMRERCRRADLPGRAAVYPATLLSGVLLMAPVWIAQGDTVILHCR